MTPDLRLLSGFARRVSLSLHVRVACLHSGSWLLSGFLVNYRLGLQFNTYYDYLEHPDYPLCLRHNTCCKSCRLPLELESNSCFEAYRFVRNSEMPAAEAHGHSVAVQALLENCLAAWAQATSENRLVLGLGLGFVH